VNRHLTSRSQPNFNVFPTNPYVLNSVTSAGAAGPMCAARSVSHLHGQCTSSLASHLRSQSRVRVGAKQELELKKRKVLGVLFTLMCSLFKRSCTAAWNKERFFVFQARQVHVIFCVAACSNGV